MSFHDMVSSDNVNVFLDTEYFAEDHRVEYDGVRYQHVKCVITQLKEKDRSVTMKDHAQGIYHVTSVFHCNVKDLNGIVPEKGGKIFISEGPFMRMFLVAQSGCDMGMVRLELEALDE